MKITTTKLNPQQLQSFTQSEMTEWDNCAEKWYLRYHQQLELKNKKPAWSLIYGTAVHTALEIRRIDNTLLAFDTFDLPIPDNCILDKEDEYEKEYFSALLPIHMERYDVKWADDSTNFSIIQSEKVLSTTFEGIELEGRIDALLAEPKKKGIIVMDTKTASRFSPDLYGSWFFKFQFMFYPWLVWRSIGDKPREFLVDLIIKPALRLGKNEILSALMGRIRADMVQEPDKYFKRISMPILKDSIERFEQEILGPKIARIKQVLTAKPKSDILSILMRNKNTDNCISFGQVCEFLPLCRYNSDVELFRYVRRQHKHEELAE
jgi:hypothetical protein